MKKTGLKSWFIGLGTTGTYLLASSNLVQGTGQCTGTCGACGFSCVTTFVPVVIIGGIALVKKKTNQKNCETRGAE